MDPGILFGLLAALGWAASDLLNSKSAKLLGASTSLLYSTAAGALFFGLIVLAGPPVVFDPSLLPLLLFSGACFVAGNLLLFLGFEQGDVSVVSSLDSIFSVPVVFVSVLFFHENLTTLQGVSVALAILGAVLVSFRWSELSKHLFSSKPVPGVKLILLSALVFGTGYSVLKPLVVSLGGPLLYFIFMLFSLPVYFLYWLTRRRSEPARMAPWLPFAAGAVLTGGNLAYAEGLRVSLASLVTPVAVIFPLFVVLSAFFLFRERLEANQYAGILLAVIGVVGLSL